MSLDMHFAWVLLILIYVLLLITTLVIYSCHICIKCRLKSNVISSVHIIMFSQLIFTHSEHLFKQFSTIVVLGHLHIFFCCLWCYELLPVVYNLYFERLVIIVIQLSYLPMILFDSKP